MVYLVPGKRKPTFVDYLGDSLVVAFMQVLLLVGSISALATRSISGGRMAFWLLVVAAIWPSVMRGITFGWHRNEPAERIRWGMSEAWRSVCDLWTLVLWTWIVFGLLSIALPILAPRYLPFGGWWLWPGLAGAMALAVPFSYAARALQRWIERTLEERVAPRPDWSVAYRQLDPRFLVYTLTTTVIISPLLEEFIQRGLLVYHLGTVLGNHPATIAGGLGLFLLVHAYHGFASVPSNILFYGIVVALLYSPLGLIGAYGFHVGCNALFAWDVLRCRKEWLVEAAKSESLEDSETQLAVHED